MTKAYEMIVNYKNLKATTRFDRQDHGMSLYNEDKEDNNSNTDKQQQSQQGGRCGHGHGHSSRWSQGGEGREYGQGNENGNIHINEEEGNKEDDTGQNNNNESVVPYSMSSPTISAAHMEALFNGRGTLLHQWILFHTCSSADLISNKSFLHDIHTVNHSINIQCNAGTITTKQIQPLCSITLMTLLIYYHWIR